MNKPKPRVIGGRVYAPASPASLPVPASAPFAFAAQSAALRLAAIVLFSASHRARKRGRTDLAAKAAREGTRLELAAKLVDQRGYV